MPNLDKITHIFVEYKDGVIQSGQDVAQYWSARIYSAAALSANIAVFLFASHIYANTEQPRMALHYSVDFGIDLYGPKGDIFIIPILGLAVLFINTLLLLVIAVYNKRDIRFLINLLLSIAMIVNLMLLAAIASIYLINFR